MFRGLFILYFALIHTMGLLSAVLASEQVNFLDSFQLLVCRAESPSPSTETAVSKTHHHEGHSHSHETDHHHHAEEPPDVPFIHCNPVPIDSVSGLLFIPFEMQEVLSSFHPAAPEFDVLLEHTSTSIQNPLPPTPPPREFFS